ncbi:hypothetical protein Tco_1359555 [Tanacetum coccineum]
MGACGFKPPPSSSSPHHCHHRHPLVTATISQPPLQQAPQMGAFGSCFTEKGCVRFRYNSTKRCVWLSINTKGCVGFIEAADECVGFLGQPPLNGCLLTVVSPQLGCVWVGSDDYHQILDFLRASHIRSPELGPPAILATIDETPYTITEESVRSQLQLADDGGIDDLPIAEIYSGMDNLGYVTEGKLTFFKNKFSPQWRFLVHTILHCLSTKSGSWDQFGSSLAVALICLSDGRKFNWSSYIFKGMVSNIGNAKKFLMYPRFLQTILGIETSITRQYHVFKLSSKLFANMKLNFAGQPMPLLAAMLSQAQEGEGAGAAASSFAPTNLVPMKLFLGGLGFESAHPTSRQCHTSGGAEDHTTLSALSSVVSTLVQKVTSLETELKAHKQLFKDVVPKLVKKVKALEVKLKTNKRKVVLSDSDQEDGGEQAVDVDALIALTNAAVTVDSTKSSGGTSSNPATCSYDPTSDVPTNVSSGIDPTGPSTVSPSSITVPTSSSIPADESIPARSGTTIATHSSPVKDADRKDAAWDIYLARLQANPDLSSTIFGVDFTDDDFAAKMVCFFLILILLWSILEKRILGLKRDGSPMTKHHQDKIKTGDVRSSRWKAPFSRCSTGTGEALEPDTSKKQKSTEAPIPSVPDVPQPKVVSSSKSSGSRRKSLGRSRITKPELDLDADDKTFIKVVSDEDSEDEAPILWSAFAGWEVISTPLGEINAMYMMDQSTKHFTTLREILHMVDRQDLLKLYGLVVKYYENHPVTGAGLMLWGDLQVLMDSQEGGKGSSVWHHQSLWQISSWRLYTLSNVHVLETVSGEVLYMFADVSYPLSVKLMERMLKHKLEIAKDVVGNDMTTAEQLIRFIKNQLAAAQVSPA